MVTKRLKQRRSADRVGVGRPDRRLTMIATRFRPRDFDRIAQIASENGTSVAAIVRYAVGDYLLNYRSPTP